MPYDPSTHEATARWEGDFETGRGTISTKSGVVRNAKTNTKERIAGNGESGMTSPEELLAAAHASCYSQKLSAQLAHKGEKVRSVDVTAHVTIGPSGLGQNGRNASRVLTSVLTVKVDAPGADPARIKELAEASKDTCPISQALANNVRISLELIS